MTIKELKDELNKYDETLEINAWADGFISDFSNVSLEFVKFLDEDTITCMVRETERL